MSDSTWRRSSLEQELARLKMRDTPTPSLEKFKEQQLVGQSGVIEKQLMERGTDWAYAQLVKAARTGTKTMVRTLAMQFKPEVLEACVGMAYCDIDWYDGNKATYEIVADVCNRLTRKR